MGRLLMAALATISRAEAKAAGLKRYFTGKPCKHGHVAERAIVSKNCLECNASYQASLRKRPEQIAKGKVLSRNGYLRNREAILAKGRARNATGYNKRYYEENKEKFLITVRAWIKRNPDRRNAYRQNRRAAGVRRLTAAAVERISHAQKGKCAACRVNLKVSGHHVDHIMPIALGGTSDPSNIQLLCPKCNRSKGARDPIVFMQSLGRLL
jgi:5-methylcytosine-specific restriction endonuclease McrA